MMKSISIELHPSSAVAPLYERDYGSFSPHSAFMQLDDDGYLTFGCQRTDSIPLPVAQQIDLRWSVPPELTCEELWALGDSVKALMEIIHAGKRVEFDRENSQLRGILDQRAKDASREVEERCCRAFEAVRNDELGACVMDPSDYFDDLTLDELGITSTSTPAEIIEQVRIEIDSAKERRILVYGDMENYMRSRISAEHRSIASA